MTAFRVRGNHACVGKERDSKSDLFRASQAHRLRGMISIPTTRWFKYDRDKLWLISTQSVPIIFEPPCIYVYVYIYMYIYISYISC
jgi:hypothetical protein